MARQAGPLYFTGTIDDITFYKMEGTYLARKKSSLDRKQFRTDPRFARSRKSAEKFGEASQLASQIYWQLPKEQRGKGVVNKLTGQVGRLLKEGKTAEEIIKNFQQQYQTEATKPAKQTQAKDTALELTPTSAWKVTPSGKLISPRLEAALSTDTASFVTAAMLNSYLAPHLE